MNNSRKINKKLVTIFLASLMFLTIFSSLSINFGKAASQSQQEDQPSADSEKYAVIMVGRYYGDSLRFSDIQNTYYHYSREAARMYLTLRDDHGYDEDNIYLLFKELPVLNSKYFILHPTFNTDWIDFTSDKVILENLLATLGNTMGEDDSLFFCFIDHGITDGNGDTYFGCPFPSIPSYLWTVFGPGDPTQYRLYDYDLANYVSSISGDMIFALHPCYSGGFIDDLSGDKRVILTSTRDEPDDGWIGGFLDALDQYDADGNPVYDDNGDGRLSMYEAYKRGAEYIENSNKPQSPLIDDNGDGQGSSFYDPGFNPNIPGNDGYIASQTFIDEVAIEKPDVLSYGSYRITEDSARLYGKLVDDGGEPSSCYLKIIGEDDPSDCFILPSGRYFGHTFSGLEEGTTYSWYAYAENSAGSDTGEIKQFTTESSSPPTNHNPILSSASVSPSSGSTDTIFVYQVTYDDEDGDVPTVKKVYIDGVSHTMSIYYSSGGSGSPFHGIYRYSTTLSEGSHGYYFVFNDGNNADVRRPSSGGYCGPSVSVDNQPPSLKSGYVTPGSGDTSTVFSYWVTYSDPEDDDPATKRVYIDGSSHSMTFSYSYTSGSILYHKYKYQTSLSEGSHTYYFRFNDGHNSDVKLPSSGSYSGPVVSSQSNQPPTLSSSSVSPSSGSTSTMFTYKIKYTDSEGDAPTVYKVYIDGSSHVMTKTSGTYSSGAWYEYSTTLSEGSHTYYFRFNDGHNADVRRPSSGTYSGPTVTQTNNWIRPAGYVSNKWDYEYRARDNDPTDSTYAKYDKVDFGCCNDALILTYSSSITIDRLKINAKYHDKMYKMEIQLFLYGNQQGSTKVISNWPDNGDMEIYVGNTNIDKVKIWFTLKTGRSFSSYPAKVYDFECRTT